MKEDNDFSAVNLWSRHFIIIYTCTILYTQHCNFHCHYIIHVIMDTQVLWHGDRAQKG